MEEHVKGLEERSVEALERIATILENVEKLIMEEQNKIKEMEKGWNVQKGEDTHYAGEKKTKEEWDEEQKRREEEEEEPPEYEDPLDL